MVTTGDCTGLELLLPKLEPEEEVPRLMLVLTACFIRLQQEPAFLDEQLDWMHRHRNS